MSEGESKAAAWSWMIAGVAFGFWCSSVAVGVFFLAVTVWLSLIGEEVIRERRKPHA